MSVENKQVRGDASVSRNVNAGGNAVVRGNAHIGHNLRVDGTIEARNIKGANKGLFLSESELNSAYPNPQDGWYAGVGSSSPFAVYIARDGEWVRTTGTFEFDVDMDSYNQRIDELESQVAELIEIILSGGGGNVVNVRVSVEGHGSVTGSGLYQIGNSVTLTATAENGYQFVEWQDAEGNTIEGAGATYTFEATESVTLKAVFAVSYYTFTATPNDINLGSVTIEADTLAEEGRYPHGTHITVTAIASDRVNAYFVRWDDGNTDNYRAIALVGNVSLQAIFAEVVRIITTAGEGGNMDMVVRRGGQEVPADEGVRIGDEITLMAIGTAYKPSAIKCGDTTIEDGEVYHIEYSQDEKTMTCTFIYQYGMPLSYTSEFNGGAITQKYRIRVLVEPEGAGTAEIIQTGESGVTNKEIDAGSYVTIHAQAHNGWRFRSWVLGGVEVEDDTSGNLTFKVTGAATYTAVFIHAEAPDFYYGVFDTPTNHPVLDDINDETGLTKGWLTDNAKAQITLQPGKTFVVLYRSSVVRTECKITNDLGEDSLSLDNQQSFYATNKTINNVAYAAREFYGGNTSSTNNWPVEITFAANSNS